MLILAVGVFTLVAVMGLGMVFDVFAGRGTSRLYAITHAGFAAFGSVLVILAALSGDSRVLINIGLVVVIVILGVTVSLRRAKGQCPKSVLVAHAGLAVVCYSILAYNAFTG